MFAGFLFSFRKKMDVYFYQLLVIKINRGYTMLYINCIQWIDERDKSMYMSWRMGGEDVVVKRQDAWIPSNDTVLAEVTLRHIREGGTQLAAFEEVAERLGRTPAACGFRWNSAVRKQYEAAIQMAKSDRQKRSQERGRASSFRSYPEELDMVEDPTYSLDNIIRFLRQHKSEMNNLRRLKKQLEQELEERELQLRKLERENVEMRNQLNMVQSDYRLVNDDYRTLVQIMERARKLTLLANEGDASRGAKFHLEEKDAIERVEK
jgi:prespore-specific regulator